MICRGCGRDIVDGEDFSMVAEWPFCAPCFEGLLEGRRKGAEEHVEETAGADSAAAGSGGQAPVRCGVCQREMVAGEERKLGPWTFCPQCFGELVSMPKVEVVGAEATGEGEAEGEAGCPEAKAGAEAAYEKEGGIDRVSVGFATYVRCKGCGRRIPLGGCKSVDGEPFCPDCYYALPAEEKPIPTSDAPSPALQEAWKMESQGEDVAHGVEERCACCHRLLRSGSYDEVDGFLLCRACLSTDAASAVQIARERHRRVLDRLKDELGAPTPSHEEGDE